MSYYKDITQTEISDLFNFQIPAVGVQNAINCTGGELAVWEYWLTDDDGNYLAKIYDASTGTPTLIATVYVCKGRDIFCGLFSSGAIPSGDIFSESCNYYRIDYI